MRQVLNFLNKPPIYNMLLDSGAFSAWRLGQPINLNEYCDFLLENQDWIGHSVALDVINPGDPEAAARESYNNYLYMRKRGLDPIPVFHVGEDVVWLKRLIAAGATYVGLSASSIAATAVGDDWYALIWNYLVNSEGLPIVKVHAFGEGRTEPLMRFPWYSADSTSWLYTSQRSGIIQLGDGKRVAFRNDGLSKRFAVDVSQLSHQEQQILNKTLSDANVSLDILNKRDSNDAFVIRAYLAALYYANLQARVRARQPIYYKPYGFIKPKPISEQAIEPFKFNLHLVAGGNYTAFAAIAGTPHLNVLASYYYLKFGGHHKHLQMFVKSPAYAMRTQSFKRHYDLLQRNLVGVSHAIS